MSSFWDDLPRGASICLIVFVGIIIILTGSILQRFIPGLVSVAFIFMVLFFAITVCAYGLRKGVLN